MAAINPSEITPEPLYRARRAFMRGAGALATGTLFAGACGGTSTTSGPGATSSGSTGGPPRTSVKEPEPGTVGATADELGDGLTSFDAIAGYNNYYEFTTDKEGVARLAQGFKTSPWTLTVGGLVRKPRTYAPEDLLARFPLDERIYRLRCVEGWSMVIPWIGFPLRLLLDEVEPTGLAQYVRFETVHRPDEMPGQRDRLYRWPYVEGLRLDEAQHDLTLMVTGLYGKSLLAQNGAPLRLAVPWKYGFKSIKSIVKIELVAMQPTSLWMAAAPHEYGFYANVNPDVPHPRWSQATERRIGETRRRRTLPFNGYTDQVAHLYAGMDLNKFY